MSELTEYFLRHYTLVIDNTQDSYYEAVRVAREVVEESGVSLSDYVAMDRYARADRFASDIGDRVMELINDWFTEAIPSEAIGAKLAGEVMILADSELEWALGDHYMPEDGDAEDFLSDEDKDA